MPAQFYNVVGIQFLVMIQSIMKEQKQYGNRWMGNALLVRQGAGNA
jgi:hypothetical protein